MRDARPIVPNRLTSAVDRPTPDVGKAPHPRANAIPAPSRTSAADGVFSSLARYPIFRRLWCGMLCASLGQWMQQVGAAWLALDLTDSKFFVGLVGFMAGLPFLAVSIPAGVLIDRVDRRRLLLVCQIVASLLACLIALDVTLDYVRPWHLLLAAFLNGTLQALMTPTQQSLVPSLVGRADLTNAIGLTSAGQNLTRAGGPFLAGGLIGVAGVGAAFILQAVSLAVAIAFVVRVVVPRQTSTRAAAGVRAAFDGIRLIRQREDLRTLFILACIPPFFVFPYIQFLSVFARDILEIGPAGLGILMAASGLGAVCGSLLTARRRESAGAGRLIVHLTVIYGVFVAGVALSQALWLTLPLLFAAGTLGAMFMSSNNALIQLRIDDAVRGRVMAAYLLTFGLMPLGALPMGIAADLINTQTAVAGGAIASSALAAALGYRSRALPDL